MKQYVVDQLRPEDQARLKVALEADLGPAAAGGIYWLALDKGFWNDIQVGHVDCQPFCVALELEADRLICELLVRTRNRMRCDCMGYADPRQRTWLIDAVDGILQRLQITV